jgi:DMSO/TMAO reductase YedYZ molybdopterin-dependent catalytic subunit
MTVLSRGFRRRSQERSGDRLPPGQYDVGHGFPVLSAGPTPRTPQARWDLTVHDETGERRRWSWEEFRALPREALSVDIHCVTTWSKFDTRWEGVSVDTLLQDAPTTARYVLAGSDGGYTTNLPLEELTGGQAWVVDTYEGQPLAPEHGGPARLLVPHLYFWKSAKWVRRLTLLPYDEPGFWETFGYHNHGDPWREERYSGD